MRGVEFESTIPEGDWFTASRDTPASTALPYILVRLLRIELRLLLAKTPDFETGGFTILLQAQEVPPVWFEQTIPEGSGF